MRNLPEIPLLMQPVSDEAKAVHGFKWAGEDIGCRSRIGGAPDSVQKYEVPFCIDCNEPMTFYAQIDSVGDEICLADVGMVFVFVCFGCFASESFVVSG